MERVPILKIEQTLFVSIQIDLQDDTVVRLQEDLADALVHALKRSGRNIGAT